MKKEQTVYLTSGPRGSGKTRYVEQIAEAYPRVALVSRDKIMTEHFGRTWLNAYSGAMLGGTRIIFEKVQALLQEGQSEVILDFWNGFSSERLGISVIFERWVLIG